MQCKYRCLQFWMRIDMVHKFLFEVENRINRLAPNSLQVVLVKNMFQIERVLWANFFFLTHSAGLWLLSIVHTYVPFFYLTNSQMLGISVENRWIFLCVDRWNLKEEARPLYLIVGILLVCLKCCLISKIISQRYKQHITSVQLSFLLVLI